MPTWVRYSVAVYLGLLLAGAVVVPEPLSAAGAWLRLGEPPTLPATVEPDSPHLHRHGPLPPTHASPGVPAVVLRHGR